ncbi:SdpI family protein [Butyrivibrio hungatei]|uniref:SdpI family protein n=1 Tax=Butyrivibrio hungatei TaxID=185008 RepID=UPI00040F6CBC|nr:SdpI family protein [Butyrivibrio hungatei]
MKKLMWSISLFSLIGTAVAIQFIPERVPMHYDAAGNVTRWGSKNENFIFPIMILFMSLIWAICIGYYEKKALKNTDEKECAEAKSNAKVISYVGVGMALMYAVMQGFILYGEYKGAILGATKQVVDIGKVTVIMMGLLFIWLGNAMPKTRINGTVGVRISWSMYNDTTWRKSNHFGGVAFVVAGVLTIITSFIVQNSSVAMAISVGYVSVAAVASFAYVHKVYKAEKREN